MVSFFYWFYYIIGFLTSPAQWETVQREFPWGILLLMGGGFALAEGARASCLTRLAGQQLAGLASLPPPAVLLLLCLLTSATSGERQVYKRCGAGEGAGWRIFALTSSAVASNSATTSILLPVVLSLAEQLDINPLYLALGVTLTASHAFVLPVSTPPNAIGEQNISAHFTFHLR